MERFGEKLRTLRNQRGLTLRQLSDLLDVGYSYVGKMERGERIPNVTMLVKVADLFDISLDKLIRDELDRNRSPPLLELCHSRKFLAGIYACCLWIPA